MSSNFIDSSIKQFKYYKWLAERAIEQVSDEQLNQQYNSQSNSIAMIMRHMSGNMLSRFTNFLTEDGEKPWRNRDAEFETGSSSRSDLIEEWERAWQCLFTSIENLQNNDLEKLVYIRNQGHTVMEAIQRQLAHYPYHVGQIVFLAKMQAQHWKSLSIARGQSNDYNSEKFAREKMRGHFTDEILKKDPENDL
ncbi:MAG: DUF1572 family protein [Chitinophagaceae bacterium]|nr:DUF1572 family protein [Chitinophagaceae bacterium]